MPNVGHVPSWHQLGGRKYARELAIEMSLTSLGSSQTLRRPHFNTEAANRFCSFKDTILPGDRSVGRWTVKERQTCSLELFTVSLLR